MIEEQTYKVKITIDNTYVVKDETPKDVHIIAVEGPKGDTGEQGETGAAAGFGTVTATIDATIGTPSVEVTTSGEDTAKNFNFAFHNLKGETGAAGQDGTDGTDGITPTIGDNGNWYLGDTDTGVAAQGPKGDKGDPGEVTGINVIAPLAVDNPPTVADDRGIAAGDKAESDNAGVAIGANSKATTGTSSFSAVAIGEFAQATDNGAANTWGPVAVGRSAKAKGTETVAVGYISSATDGGTAIGAGATADNGTAIGKNSEATSSGIESATAIGEYASATAQNSIALGNYSEANEYGVISVGSGDPVATLSEDMDEETKARAQARAASAYRRVANVDDPTNPHDAANKNYVDSSLDQTVQRDTTISASESTVSLNVAKGNIADKSSNTSQVALPVASATSAGVLNAATFQAIQNNAELVDSILDGTVSLNNLPTNPSQDDLTNAWKTATGRDTVINGATIDDQVNAKTWRYYSNINEWRGNDSVTPQITVNQWTNTSAGIIKGSTAAGQIFAEADGTGSVNGWDELNTSVANNTASIGTLNTQVGSINTSVQGLSGRMTTAENDISNIENSMVTSTEVSNMITSRLSGYATNTSVTNAINNYTLKLIKKTTVNQDSGSFGLNLSTTEQQYDHFKVIFSMETKSNIDGYAGLQWGKTTSNQAHWIGLACENGGVGFLNVDNNPRFFDIAVNDSHQGIVGELEIVRNIGWWNYLWRIGRADYGFRSGSGRLNTPNNLTSFWVYSGANILAGAWLEIYAAVGAK
ncbi:hypothetical protein [Megamonas hypermegale]|uniref:hypothetical protein n=1 Tax=Megamonas hypermegale TaxID=158847 RepID=UPI0026EC4485|nr:hypothetical protein [Megamonas hypermegale]